MWDLGGRKRARVLVVGWLYTQLACMPCLCAHCACVGVHEHCSTVPLYGLLYVMCMSTACWNSLCLSSYHLLDPFESLVDSLVTCQRLTSLKLDCVTLSLQSLLAIVKGLYNLRALELDDVSLSNKTVSI